MEGLKRRGFFRNIKYLGKVFISSSGALAPLVFSFFFFCEEGTVVFRIHIFSAVFEVCFSMALPL